MVALPRFVQKRVSLSGDTSYRFNPPQKLVNAGVVSREELGNDLRVSRQLAKELNKQIDDWREEQAKVVNIKPSGKVTDLINFYYSSNDFNMLRESTKIDYRYFLTILHQTMGCRSTRMSHLRLPRQRMRNGCHVV